MFLSRALGKNSISGTAMAWRTCLWATAAAVSAILGPTCALAWGDDGHEIVAKIAQSYLNPTVATKVSTLLSADTADGLTASDFVSRATWADKYRDSDRPHGPRYEGTHNWHFVDIPLSTAADANAVGAAETSQCPYPALRGQTASLGAPAKDCVIDKIRQFEIELSDPATPKPERIFALKFLLHFVGDVHQPLHAVDDNDQGANCVWIKPQGAKVKLHSWWDNALISEIENGRDVTDTAAALRAEITPALKASWETDDPASWAAESFLAAKSVGYNLQSATLPTCATENVHDPLPLPDGYDAAAQATAKTQLEKAGVRLAFVLNKALAGVTP